MSENKNYTRFRRDGRSGTDTYSKLYSRENCIPRPDAKRKVRHTAVGMRDLLSHDKEKYLNGTPNPPRRYSGTFGKRVRELYDKAPQGVRDVGTAIEETAEKVRNWRYLRAAVRTLIAAITLGLIGYSLIMTAGFQVLKKYDMVDSLSVNYSEFKSFNPNKMISSSQVLVPELDTSLTDISESDLSGTDLSGTDISESDISSTDIYDEEEALSITDFVVVSQCDIPEAVSTGAKLKTILCAGIDALTTRNFNLELYARVEAGTESISPMVYSRNGNPDVSFVIPPTEEQLHTVGCHTLRVRTNGKECNVLLVVEDTTAPIVKLHDVDIWLGDSVKPEAFIDSVIEASPLVVSFSSGEPDLTLAGQQLVYLDVKDISGNSSELLAARLNIAEDTEPPVIKGAKDRVVVIGESVSYKQGITVTDNRDEDVKLQVDSSGVDPTKTGTYDVIYTAVDRNGNTATVTVKFKFGTRSELDTDIDLEERVQKVARNIIKSGMSEHDKIKAIYDWCRKSISYTGHSEKGNWKKAAITGFKKRAGDCYTYFACAKALFEYCGIENIDVVKVKNSSSESSHYWSLVDIGSGYYHFDATPRIGGFNGFMRTDKQIKTYSSNHKNSHRFDASKYPSTPAESYSEQEA